jgi:hypothetical protein
MGIEVSSIAAYTKDRFVGVLRVLVLRRAQVRRGVPPAAVWSPVPPARVLARRFVVDATGFAVQVCGLWAV